MDDQIKQPEPINQEPVNTQEPPIQEPPIQEPPILEAPQPELPPQPETPIVEQAPEPELPPIQPKSELPPQPEPKAPSNEYQQILNQYAVSQEQPVVEAPPEEPAPQNISDYNIPTAPKTSIFKVTFIIALVIFVIILAVLGLSYFKTKQTTDNSGSNSNTVQNTPTPSSNTTCSLNDKIYTVGQSFPSADGCNTCSCAELGQIICTEKACAPTPTISTSSAKKNNSNAN